MSFSPFANNATVTAVESSALNVTLLSANTGRRGFSIWNNSTQVLYVKFGATASSTDCTRKLIADEFWECDMDYNGRVDGIWASANGYARVTEIV